MKNKYQSNIIVSSYGKDEAFLVFVARGVSKGSSLKKLRGGVMCGRYRLLILLIETISFHQGLLRYNLYPKQFQYNSCHLRQLPIFYGVCR